MSNKLIFGLMLSILFSSQMHGQATSGIPAPSISPQTVPVVSILSQGGICSGSSNPASSHGYTTLTALQVKYSFATATSNQMDWLSAQLIINTFGTNGVGGTLQIPGNTCEFDQPLVIPTTTNWFGNAPNGGYGININGVGTGVSWIIPTADFGTASGLISCGTPSATPNVTTGSGSGRYANAACPGWLSNFSINLPGSTISTFGVAPTISGTSVGMDGILTGIGTNIINVNVFGFYNGINLVGAHQIIQNVLSNHNYCGLYFAPENVNDFGDIVFESYTDFGGNSMAGLCVSKDSYISVKQSGEMYDGHQPYGILKYAGTPDAYALAASGAVTSAASSFQEIQAESIGNAWIWDDNYTQSGGGINTGETVYNEITGTLIHGYSSYNATYTVTAGGRGFYAYVGSPYIAGLELDLEDSPWPYQSGMLYGAYTTALGSPGLVISGDLNSLASTYGNVPIASNEQGDNSSNNIQLIDPGIWSGGCLPVFGSTTVSAGQLLSNSGTTYAGVATGTQPIIGVAMQTMTIPSSVTLCVPYANKGPFVTVATSGVSSTQQGQMLIAGASGNAIPYGTVGGYAIGTMINSISGSQANVDLSLGPFMPGQLAQLSSTYTNSTTGFTNVTGLAFPVVASQILGGTCYLVYSASATTAGPKIQFTGPASPTAVNYSAFFQITATPTYIQPASSSAFSTSLSPGTAVTATTRLTVQISFGIINGSTAGTVQLQAAANGTGTVTIEPGSWCKT